METAVLLELHEKVNVVTLLTNCESWTLLQREINALETAEIQCLKSMFDLPVKTPTPGIMFTLGTLFTRFRIIQKQLIYLQRVLQRQPEHWTRKILTILIDLNIGWYRYINEILKKFRLTQNAEEIKSMTQNEWKNKVKSAVEEKHKEKLLDDCHKTVDGTKIPKTKTAHIVQKLMNSSYTRNPEREITH